MKFEKNEIDSEQKEIKVYGTHQVNDSLVLIVCRGVMNDKDIWIADVHKKGEKWEAEEISQMNGPLEWLEWDGDIQSITKNDEFGYEFGYIKSGASPTEDLNVIEVEGISDWKIWIK